MAAPVPATFYAGQRWRAADVNSQIRDNLSWAIAGKTCRAVRDGASSIPNGLATLTAIPFNTEDFDPLGWHPTTGLTNIILPDIEGYYAVSGNVEFVANATGVRKSYIRARTYNAGPYLMASQTAPAVGGGANDQTSLSVSTTVYLNGSTDYVELVVSQNSGAALSTTVTNFNTSLSLTLIGTV